MDRGAWYKVGSCHPDANWVLRETWAQSLDWKDTLEEGKATHSSILAWRLPWTEEPGGLQSMGRPALPSF